jgi:uncharacterized protein
VKIYAILLLLLAAAFPCAAAQDNGPDAEAVAKQIVQEIAAGQFDRVEERYTPEMSASLPAGTLAKVWASVLQQEGAFNSVVSAASAAKVQTFDVIVVVTKFEKATVDIQIAISPDGKVGGIHLTQHREPPPPWTTPSYGKPDAFSEMPLALTNGKFEMPGTLSMPKGSGPFPGVVLVQGSGRQDEDETVAASKPLKDVAWGLASKGIAVYRYEKRTEKYGEKSSDDPAKLTVDDETMSDARAAVSLLAKQKNIDPAHVFLLGHSLGAYLAPRIATSDGQIAGIVMMAANTDPMEKLLVDQVHYIIANGPAPTADEQAQVTKVEQAVKQIDSPDLKQGDTINLLSGPMPASYWLDLRDYHPIAAAEALKIPILILQGGRDFQVPPATNFDELKKALDNDKFVTFRLYPTLNHLFISGTGISLPQEYEKPGHVDEQVISDIAAWINHSEAPHLGQSH